MYLNLQVLQTQQGGKKVSVVFQPLGMWEKLQKMVFLELQVLLFIW